MARKPFVAGNWKMHNNLASGRDLVEGLKAKMPAGGKVDVAVCPPFTLLTAAAEWVKGSEIGLGAQDCHFEEKGAYTGEVAPSMLTDVGCKYVILGHSERRQYFKEDGELLTKKVRAAQAAGLHVIFCIGESLEQREANETEQVVEKQIKEVLKNDLNSDLLTIAYEPVWAIGTGKTATPEQAQDVHKFVRGLVASIFDSSVAEKIRIQYGGSVKPGNAKELFSCPDIDGGLVGGACLVADDFAAIISAAAEIA